MSENTVSGRMPTPASRQAAPKPEIQTLKVMIAEDDLLLADMLEEALTNGGYEVCGIADTVEEAVELGERHKPDLAVLDIRLAKGGLGTDIPARLNRPASMGVLFASGQVGQLSLTKTDGDCLITKPYRSEDIIRGLEIVKEILRTCDVSGPLPGRFSVLAESHKNISSLLDLTRSPGGSSDSSAIESNDQIRRLRLQQTELLNFNNYALSEADMGKLMSEGTRVCAACLATPYCAIVRIRADDNAFVADATFGMRRGFAGRVLENPDLSTPFGRAFITGRTVVSDDLLKDLSFSLPPYFAEYGIISMLAVPIMSGIDSASYGVLAVGSTARRTFDGIDANFLAGFSNALRQAIDAASQGRSLHGAATKIQDMIAERDRYLAEQEGISAGKDRLLEVSGVLARELKHRVRNNLQLILSMLNSQIKVTTDPSAIEGLGKIERRVMTLVGIYETLNGANLGQTLNFGGYLSSLCSNFLALHIASSPKIALTCRSVPVSLGLDEVTTLGLIISELIANSYKHAFPDDTGTISVSLSVDHSSGTGTITFVDDGVGFADAGDSKRHGVGLVKRLIAQIGGSTIHRSGHGSEWILKFPVPTTSAIAPAYAD
jgi:two-component sensor histidine kinase/CheY-like chemotaxis protein